MPKTPTARSLEYGRKHGMLIGITERWVEKAKKRIDLFGFIDLIAICDERTIGIQATTGANVSGRLKKIRTERVVEALVWLEAGNAIEVWGWRQVAVKRGGKAKRWQVRRVPVTLEDLTK